MTDRQNYSDLQALPAECWELLGKVTKHRPLVQNLMRGGYVLNEEIDGPMLTYRQMSDLKAHGITETSSRPHAYQLTEYGRQIAQRGPATAEFISEIAGFWNVAPDVVMRAIGEMVDAAAAATTPAAFLEWRKDAEGRYGFELPYLWELADIMQADRPNDPLTRRVTALCARDSKKE